ncbi:uncharacterized protein LOC143244625 [Tachypleus tridentatus]|uniref:uncharacterized protein LOC143244625 n=1 Tax=Tachypleus tridentatus TaxID=6853 RepID=UPI003FD551E3
MSIKLTCFCFVVNVVVLLKAYPHGSNTEKLKSDEPSNLWDILKSDDILEKISLDDYLRNILENFREDMRIGIDSLKIPILDPFSLPEAVIDVNEDVAKVKTVFKNLVIKGMSYFYLEQLATSLKYLSISFSITLEDLFASGYYELDGLIISFIPLRGNGSCIMQVKNVTLSATASLDTTEDGKLQMANDFDVFIYFDSVYLDFENLLGGGKWTEVIKNVVNKMANSLFDKFLPLIKGELNNALRGVINRELLKLPIKAIIPGSTANEYVDQILDNVKEQIKHYEMDPMPLPEYYSNFSKTVLFVTVYGEAKLFDGLLSGISSIHRTGDCELDASNDTLIVSANLGLRNLKISYTGHAKFMSLGPTIQGTGSVERLDFYFKVKQSNEKSANPELGALDVTNMSTIWFDLSGLGPLTWILQYLMTGIIKLINGFLVGKMMSYLREYIVEQLAGISFPIG